MLPANNYSCIPESRRPVSAGPVASDPPTADPRTSGPPATGPGVSGSITWGTRARQAVTCNATNCGVATNHQPLPGAARKQFLYGYWVDYYGRVR